MSLRLKDFFGDRVVRVLARELQRVYRKLDEARFVAEALDGLDQRELLPRGQQLADVMRRHLPQPFAAAAKLLLESLRAPAPRELGGPLADAFFYLPHALFVQTYGVDDLELSLALQYEITQRFTAESSIRPFLQRYPQETLARLQSWARDPNVHVRRLVSEGTRPRLPWAPRLRAFQADPAPVLALLELLRDDPERYVQRSVANNLNDIAKDHPELAVETCRRWAVGAPPARLWIIRHALRSLVKRGHRGALALMGAGGRPHVKVSALRLTPKPVRIGGALRFSLALSSTARRTQTLLVDYVVHFVKANGETRPKVFKLKQLSLAPGETCTLSSKVSFVPLTTRKPYPGRHRLELLVNGVPQPLATFEVRPALASAPP